MISNSNFEMTLRKRVWTYSHRLLNYFSSTLLGGLILLWHWSKTQFFYDKETKSCVMIRKMLNGFLRLLTQILDSYFQSIEMSKRLNFWFSRVSSWHDARLFVIVDYNVIWLHVNAKSWYFDECGHTGQKKNKSLIIT